MRNKPWQAEYMTSAVRDHVMALACLRLGLPSAHGRGMDSLPAAVIEPLRGSIIGRLDPDELRRALGVVVNGLAEEVAQVDSGLAHRVSAEIRALSVFPDA